MKNFLKDHAPHIAFSIFFFMLGMVVGGAHTSVVLKLLPYDSKLDLNGVLSAVATFFAGAIAFTGGIYAANTSSKIYKDQEKKSNQAKSLYSLLKLTKIQQFDHLHNINYTSQLKELQSFNRIYKYKESDRKEHNIDDGSGIEIFLYEANEVLDKTSKDLSRHIDMKAHNISSLDANTFDFYKHSIMVHASIDRIKNNLKDLLKPETEHTNEVKISLIKETLDILIKGLGQVYDKYQNSLKYCQQLQQDTEQNTEQNKKAPA